MNFMFTVYGKKWVSCLTIVAVALTQVVPAGFAETVAPVQNEQGIATPVVSAEQAAEKAAEQQKLEAEAALEADPESNTVITAQTDFPLDEPTPEEAETDEAEEAEPEITDAELEEEGVEAVIEGETLTVTDTETNEKEELDIRQLILAELGLTEMPGITVSIDAEQETYTVTAEGLADGDALKLSDGKNSGSLRELLRRLLAMRAVAKQLGVKLSQIANFRLIPIEGKKGEYAVEFDLKDYPSRTGVNHFFGILRNNLRGRGFSVVGLIETHYSAENVLTILKALEKYGVDITNVRSIYAFPLDRPKGPFFVGNAVYSLADVQLKDGKHYLTALAGSTMHLDRRNRGILFSVTHVIPSDYSATNALAMVKSLDGLVDIRDLKSITAHPLPNPETNFRIGNSIYSLADLALNEGGHYLAALAGTTMHLDPLSDQVLFNVMHTIQSTLSAGNVLTILKSLEPHGVKLSDIRRVHTVAMDAPPGPFQIGNALYLLADIDFVKGDNHFVVALAGATTSLDKDGNVQFGVLNAIKTDLGHNSVNNLLKHLAKDGVSVADILAIKTHSDVPQLFIPNQFRLGIKIVVRAPQVGGEDVQHIYEGIISGTTVSLDELHHVVFGVETLKMTDAIIGGRSLAESTRDWPEGTQPDPLQWREVVRNADGTYTVKQAILWANETYEDSWHYILADGAEAGDRVVMNRYYKDRDTNPAAGRTASIMGSRLEKLQGRYNRIDKGIAASGYAYYPDYPNFDFVLHIAGLGSVNFATGEITGEASLEDFINRIEAFQPVKPRKSDQDLDHLTSLLKKLVTQRAKDIAEKALAEFRQRHKDEILGDLFNRAVSIEFVRDAETTLAAVRAEILRLAKKYKIKEGKLLSELDKIFRECIVKHLDGYIDRKDLLFKVNGKTFQAGPDDVTKSIYELVRNLTYDDPNHAVTVEDMKASLMKAMIASSWEADYNGDGRIDDKDRDVVKARIARALDRVFSGLPQMDEYFDNRRIAPSLLSSIDTFELLSPAGNRELVARLFAELPELLENVPGIHFTTLFPEDKDRNGIAEVSLVNFNRYLEGTLPAYELLRQSVERILQSRRAEMDALGITGLQTVDEGLWQAARALLKKTKGGIESELRRIVESARVNIEAAGLKTPVSFEYNIVNETNGQYQPLVSHFDYIVRFVRYVVFDTTIDGAATKVQIDLEQLTWYFTSQVEGTNGLAALPRIREFVKKGLLDMDVFERENERSSSRRIEMVSLPYRDNSLSYKQGYYDFFIQVARVLIDRASKEELAALLSAGEVRHVNIAEYRKMVLTNDAIEKKMDKFNKLVDKNVNEIREILKGAPKPLYLWLIRALESRGTEVRSEIIKDLEDFIKKENLSHTLVLSEVERRANEIFQRLVNTIENEIDKDVFKIEVDGKDIVMTMGELLPIIDQELVKVSVGGGRINAFLMRLNITEADLKGLETEFVYSIWRQIRLGGPSLDQAFDKNATLSRRGLRDLIADRVFARYMKEDPNVVRQDQDVVGAPYKVVLEAFRMRLTNGKVRQTDLLSQITNDVRKAILLGREALEAIRTRIQANGAFVEDIEAIENLIRKVRQSILDAIAADLAAAGLKLEDLYSYETGRILHQIQYDYPANYADLFNETERLIQSIPVVQMKWNGEVIEIDWQRLAQMIPSWIDLERFEGIKAHQDVLKGKETNSIYYFLSRFAFGSEPQPETNGFSPRGIRQIVFDLIRKFGPDVVGKDTNGNGKREVSITDFRKAIYGFYIILNRELEFAKKEVARATREILALGIGKGTVPVELLRKLEEILRSTRELITNHLIHAVRNLDREFVLDIEGKVGREFALLVAEADQWVNVKDVVFDVNWNGKDIKVQIPVKDLINILIEEAERKLGHKIEGIYDLLKLAAVTFDMVNGKDTMAQFLMKRQVFTPEPNNSTVVRVKQKFSPLGYRDLVIEIIQRAAARFGKDLFEGPNAAGNYTVDQKAFRKMLDSRDHRSVLKDDILARINETMAEIRKTIGGNEDSVSKVSMDNLRKVNEIVSQFGIKDLIKKVRNYMLGKEEETAFIDEIKALITDGYKQVTDLELKLYTKIITAQIERPTIHGTVKETVEFRLKDLYNVIAEELKLDENASFHSLLGIAIDEWDLQGLVSEEEFKNRRTVNLGDLTIEKLYENPTEDFDTKVLMLDNLDVVADGNRFAQASMMMAASMAVMESSSMRVASDSMMVADVAYEMPVVSYKRRPVYWWNPTPEVPKGTPSIFAKAELIARLLQKFSASVAKNGQIAVETFRKELRRSDSDRVREFVDKTVKEALREIARIGGVTKNTVQWHAFAKVIKAANGTKEAIESYLRLYNPDRFDYAERSEISTNANESFTKLVNLVDFTLGFDTATNTHKKDIIVTLGKAEVRLTVDALNELVRTAIEKRRAARVDDLLNRNDYEQSWQFYQNRRIDIPSGDIYPIRPMPIRMEPVLMDVAYAESAVEMVSMKAAPAMKVARVDLMQTPVYVDQIVYPETCYGCGIMPEYPAYNWEFSGLSLVGQVEFLAALIEEMFADAGSSLIKKEKGNPFLTVNKQTFEKELNRVKRPVVFRAAADQVAFARPVEFLVKDATAPRTKLALPSETRVEAAPVRNYFDDRVKRSNGRGDKKKSRKYHEPLKFNRLSKNLVKATQASVRRAKDEQAFYSLAAVSRPVLAAVMPLHEMAKAMQPQGIVMQLRQMLAESAVEEPFFENFENTEEEETA